MEFNLKRPKRIDEEDEDDLIRFQEEFLKNKSSEQPAAKVIRRNEDNEKSSQPIKAPNKFQIDCNSTRVKKSFDTVVSYLS